MTRVPLRASLGDVDGVTEVAVVRFLAGAVVGAES